jgi:hypothetical protein
VRFVARGHAGGQASQLGCEGNERADLTQGNIAPTGIGGALQPMRGLLQHFMSKKELTGSELLQFGFRGGRPGVQN